MFSCSRLLSVALTAIFVGSAAAKPLPHHPTGEAHGLNERHHPSGEVHETRSINGISPISLNGWNGLQSLNDFDRFFGAQNFDGSRNQQVVFLNEQNICQAQQINIVQQQLAILQETAKQVILQSICDLQAQAIILSQFQNGFDVFGRDLQRLNGRFPGFDKNIADKVLQLFVQDQDRFRLNNIDFGFQGFDIGKQLVVPGITGGFVGNELQQFFDAQGAARAARDITELLRLSK